MQIAFAGFGIPANEGISWCDLPSSRTKEETGKGVGLVVEGDIFHVFPNRPAVAKVMVEPEKGLKERLLLEALDRFNLNRGECFQLGLNG